MKNLKLITATAGSRLKTISGKHKKIEAKQLVSIIMPVYNAAPYLAEAVDSILNQTYKNFEFIIIDDASTDGSSDILAGYAGRNKRIKLLKNKRNLGISESAKKLITASKGDFIARMDADDIALPDRIARQVAHLQKHKQTVALGGRCVLIDKNGKVIGSKKFPTKFADIYRYIFEFVPLQQPTLMIAKNRLPKNFVYYKDGMNTAEEVELFFKLFMHGKVENLRDTVLKYRIHGNNTSLKDAKRTFYLTLISRLKAVLYYNYKPRFTGIAITILQLLLVLVLPNSAIIGLYKIRRALNTYKINLNFFSSRKTSLSLDEQLGIAITN